jgi:hypothetical protein
MATYNATAGQHQEYFYEWISDVEEQTGALPSENCQSPARLEQESALSMVDCEGDSWMQQRNDTIATVPLGQKLIVLESPLINSMK